MIGGKVTKVFREDIGTTVLTVNDVGEVCHVRCWEIRSKDKTTVDIQVGDTVWWQADMVLWTPAGEKVGFPGSGCGDAWDIVLPKVGYTFR